MPRKKNPPKFKYTTRKKDRNGNLVLYVIYPLPGEKYPVWKKPPAETQEAVNATIEEIKTEYAHQRQSAQIPQRCSEFFDFWLNLVKTNVSPRTIEDRRSKIDNYLRPEFGEMELREVGAIRFKLLYAKLVSDGLMPNTIRKLHSIAFLIFKEATELKVISDNPLSSVKPPAVGESKRVKFLTMAQVKEFQQACKTAQSGIIFDFALETGMRPQEYLALSWTDIDLEKRSVEVHRALVYSQKGGGFYFKKTKTKKGRRTIPLSQQICEKLQLHQEKQKKILSEIAERLRRRSKPSRENRREHNKQILANHTELNLVFPSQDFTPFKDINLGRRYFKPLAAKVKLDKTVSLYALRHTSISLLLATGVDLKTISERAGHSSVAFTMDVYAHLIGNQMENATDKLAELLYSENDY